MTFVEEEEFWFVYFKGEKGAETERWKVRKTLVQNT
jgi:hypothetical protein